MLIQKFVSDKATLGSKDTWQELPDGRLIVPVTLTRTGVFKYLYSEIFGEKDNPDYPKSMFKDGIVSVYRSKEEVLSDKSLNSMKGMFFTDEHPDEEVTTDNYLKYDKGSFSTDLKVREEKYNDYSLFFVDSFLTIKDKFAKELLKKSIKNQISLGYTAYYKYSPGTFGGITHDFLQVDIENNHGALVKNGRAGPLVKIKSRTGDLETVFEIQDSEDSKENIIENIKEKRFMLDIRGVKVDFKDENSEILVKQELETLTTKTKDLDSEVQSKVRTIDSLRAENLKLSSDLENANSVNHEAIAEERAETITKARVYLKDADFRGKSISAIQEMAVREAYKSKDLSEISKGFITDSFRMLEDKPVIPPVKNKISDSFNGVKPVLVKDEDSEANDMANSILNAYRGN